MYCEGQTLPQIAATVGASQSTVAKWSSKNNWKAQRALAGTSRESGSQPSDFSDLSLSEKQHQYSENMENVALEFSEHAASLAGSQLVPVADRLKKLDDVSRRALKMEPKPACLVQIGLLTGPIEQRRELTTPNHLQAIEIQ
jgi:hypothetical protein